MSENFNCNSQQNNNLRALVQTAWKIDCPDICFEHIYQDYYQQIYAHCLNMIGSPACTEDLTQRILLQIKDEPHALDNNTVLATHLYRITVQYLLAYFSSKNLQIDLRLDTADVITALEKTNNQQEQSLSSNAVKEMELPASYLAVLLLHNYQDFYQPENAKTTFAKGHIK